MFFYTDTFGISAAAVGTMFLMTRIWDTANDPLMGMIADRTNTKYGKFRPWILWMIIPFVVTGIVLFITPNFSTTGKIIYAYVTYTLVMMAYTGINVPYGALLGVISPNSDERTKLASYRFLGAFAGNLIIQGTLLLLVDYIGKGNNKIGYPLAFSVYAVIAGALWVFTFSSTKERVKPPKAKNTIKSDLKDLLKNKPWLILSIMGIVSLIWVSIRNAAMLYYFKYYVGDAVKSAPFMVVGTFFSLAGVAATPYLVKFFKGKKRTFIITNIANAIVTSLFFLAGPKDFFIMYSTQIIGSFFGGTLMPLVWPMYADTADYGEWKFNRRATGLVFSAATFAQKMGWTVGGWITAMILTFFGYVANVEQSAKTLNGIKHMMSTIPAIILILVSLIALFYNLDGNLMKQIEADLEVRKKGQG